MQVRAVADRIEIAARRAHAAAAADAITKPITSMRFFMQFTAGYV
jgi:hypothetical protein